MINLFLKKLNENAKYPAKAHETDAGFDIYSLDDIVVYPNRPFKASTGIAVQGKFVDENDAKKFFIKMQVEGTSGNAAKVGIFPIGGVVDQGYIGEIGVVIVNGTDDPIKIEAGRKIAQLVPEVLPKITNITYLGVNDEFEQTDRGASGFGSTGTAL